MSEADFEAAVSDALNRMPAEVARAMDNVAVFIDDDYTPQPGEDPDTERVGNHRSDSVISAAPDWSLERAAIEMSRRHVRHLVVVERGELVGVLSMRDIVRCWVQDGATSELPRDVAEST